MNQAPNRRLRNRCLLLLAPLLVGSTPALPPLTRDVVLAQLKAPHHLAFVDLPQSFVSGTCVPLAVEVRDEAHAPVPAPAPIPILLQGDLREGSFYSLYPCFIPDNEVQIEKDATAVSVWFLPRKTGPLTLTAVDPQRLLGAATTGPHLVVPGPAHHLKFQFAAPVIAGAAVEITVGVFDALGNPAVDYSGTIHFDTSAPNATLPADYTFNPAVDAGKKTFLITYTQAGLADLEVVDIEGRITGMEDSQIRVLAGPTTRFRIENLPERTTAGDPHSSVRVIPEDAAGNVSLYTGSLHFSSDDSQLVLPPDGPLQTSYSLTFKSAGMRNLTVTNPEQDTMRGVATLEVLAGPFSKVAPYARSTNPVAACEEVTIALQAVDVFGNRVEGARMLSLCKQSGLSATITTYTLEPIFVEGDCIEGVLPQSGYAEVRWRSEAEEEVTFTVSGVPSTSGATVLWKKGIPSSTRSTLSIPGHSEASPALRLLIGQLTLRVELRDACGLPAVVPAGAFSIAAESPLALRNPPTPVGQSQWTVEVRLPECPTNDPATLALWPMIANEPLLTSNSERFEQTVTPLCTALAVQLSVRPKEEGMVAEPGATVEFVAELTSDEEHESIRDGELRMHTSGLTVLEASLDNQPLSRRGDEFVLPELRPGMTQTVNVKAQATTKLEEPVNAKVWYASADGTKLTPSQTVSFDRADPGVDVGCSCQAGDLPSQLLPWLALLVAASRPGKRLRRLTRGERIDRQAPW